MSVRIEGLILKSLIFKESDHILTVFSKEQGLVSLFSKKKNPHSLNSPLIQAEFVVEQGKGELYPCKEISLINSFLKIREKIESFEAAFQLVRAILDSQFPHKPAPQLYELFIRYLQEIPQTSNPGTLSSSFFLKVLRHEGLFGLSFRCSACQIELQTGCYVHQGESFCSEHSVHPYIPLNVEELEILLFLASCRNLKEISSKQVPQIIHKKTLELFSQLISP